MSKWQGVKIEEGYKHILLRSLPDTVNSSNADDVVDVLAFEACPISICGDVQKKSLSVQAGTVVSRRKCLCLKSLVVRSDKDGRAFVACVTRSCKYFRWADAVLDPPYYNLAHSKVTWRPLSAPVFKLLPSVEPLAEHICQGSLGDCWFLSALSVLCENQDALLRVLGRTAEEGSSFRFCSSGMWKTVTVDDSVPHCITGPKTGSQAFAKAKNNISFGPLVEKAYAKNYGNYAALNGGFVSEALFDLTGCPTESYDLNYFTDRDLLWAKLKSWKDSGFLVGCATSSSIPSDDDEDGQGLVTLHAYAVTDAVELFDVPVGKQTKITDFLSNKGPVELQRIERLRLVQIRNPWGRKEWTGDWSGKSDKWTRSVIEKLPSYAQRDMKGKFWMDFDDFVTAFSEVEVAKTHVDWFSLALTLPPKIVCRLTELLSGRRADDTVPRIHISTDQETTAAWAYMMLVHPSTRGTKASFYPDVHMILVDTATREVHASLIGQVDRVMTLETMLTPKTEYELIFFTLIDGLIAPCKWEAVIRVLSASPVQLTLGKSDILPQRIESFQFEQELIRSLELEQTIVITEGIAISVYSSSSTAAFVLSYDGFEPYEIEIVVNLASSNLKSVGRWRHTTIPQTPGRVVLGIITQKKTQYSSSRIRLSGYEFEIDIGPGNGKRHRSITAPEPPSEVIELD